MNLQLSDELNEIISYSKEEAMRMGSYTIGTDHLILGILRHQDNSAFEAIMKFGVDYKVLKARIEEKLKIGEMVPFEQADKLSLSKGTESSLKVMYLEARSLDQGKPGPLHLLLAIMRVEESVSVEILKEYQITYDSIKATLKGRQLPKQSQTSSFDEEMESRPRGGQETPSKGLKSPKQTSDTPVIDSFGYDLTLAGRRRKTGPGGWQR